jgi:hypothetical protein
MIEPPRRPSLSDLAVFCLLVAVVLYLFFATMTQPNLDAPYWAHDHGTPRCIEVQDDLVVIHADRLDHWRFEVWDGATARKMGPEELRRRLEP